MLKNMRKGIIIVCVILLLLISSGCAGVSKITTQPAPTTTTAPTTVPQKTRIETVAKTTQPPQTTSAPDVTETLTTTSTPTTPAPTTTAIPTTTPAPTTSPAENLVFLVGFDENRGLFEGSVFDTSALGNDGTLYGLGNETNWTVGQVGSALNFDGVNDIVNFGSPSILDFDMNPYTVSVWINPRADSIDQGQDIIAKANRKFYSWDMAISDLTSTELRIEFLCGTEVGSVSFESYYEPRLDWNHVVVKRNSSGGYIYINGHPSWDPNIGKPPSNCANANASAPGVDMIVGYNEAWWQGYFNGSIDEVAIFNRSLSDDEIKAIYSSTQYFTG